MMKHRLLRNYILNHPDMKGIPVGIETSMDENIDAIFVYGLLQPGFGMYDYYAPNVVTYTPDAFITGYRMYASGFPIAVKDRTSDGPVWGTLLFTTNTERLLKMSDRVELGAGYIRKRETVATPYGPVEAWMYEYVSTVFGKEVKSGDFLTCQYAQ